MRRGRALLLTGLLWVGVPGACARAQASATPPCPQPEHLVLRDLSLPAARADLARDGRLVILTIGGAATAGAAAGDPAAAYPARLQVELEAALPGKAVTVLNKATARRDVAPMAKYLSDTIHATGARLVIWATGAREAARSADIDDYVAGLVKGIASIRAAGADVILLDMQFAPSIAGIINFAPYRDALRGTAEAYAVPLLRRYDLMQQWSDDGVMNLDARDDAERRMVARKLFACIAAALAPPIAQAVR